MSLSLSKAATAVKFSSSAQAAAEAGMRKILNLHTRDELAKLCDELGLPDEGLQKDEIVAAIFRAELSSVDDYRRVLSIMWEGVVIEYLTLEFGVKLKSYNMDPKRAVLRRWQEASKNDLAAPVASFGRIFVPVTTNRLDVKAWADPARVAPDPVIVECLRGIEAREKVMKDMERNIRANDYRSILNFFKVIAEVRLVEEDLRNYVLQDLYKSRHRAHLAVNQMRETHERMDTVARKHNNWVNRQMRENSAAKSTTEWLQEIAMETASDCGMYRDIQLVLKREILNLQQDLARARERSRTFEMETHELRQRLVESAQENQRLRDDMESYRVGIRQHFGDMEQDYIKVRGELQQLRFDHRALEGRSSQEIARLRMTLEECDQRFGAHVGGGSSAGGGRGRGKKGAAKKKGAGAGTKAAGKRAASQKKNKVAGGGRAKSPPVPPGAAGKKHKGGPAVRAKSPQKKPAGALKKKR